MQWTSLPAGHRGLDRVEEADEFLVTVALHAAAEHRAVQDVERGEQRGGAVADIVVGHRPGLARLERQPRLCAIEGLNLAFLVDREHDRMPRWRHVKPDDVRELGDELGVTAALEAAQTMGLQLVGRPDPLHGPQGKAVTLAIIRPVQWVVSAGGSAQVSATTRCTTASGVGGLPGFLVLSCNSPSTPASAKRCCQRHTAGRLIPARRAIAATSSRSAEARMIRARAHASAAGCDRPGSPPSAGDPGRRSGDRPSEPCPEA